MSELEGRRFTIEAGRISSCCEELSKTFARVCSGESATENGES